MSDTVVSIPVPPVKSNVSEARATVSLEPESAPTVNVVVMLAVLAAVTHPLAFTVNTGIAVAPPNEPTFELTVASVTAPVSASVASPDMTLSIQTELPVSYNSNEPSAGDVIVVSANSLNASAVST